MGGIKVDWDPARPGGRGWSGVLTQSRSTLWRPQRTGRTLPK